MDNNRTNLEKFFNPESNFNEIFGLDSVEIKDGWLFADAVKYLLMRTYSTHSDRYGEEDYLRDYFKFRLVVSPDISRYQSSKIEGGLNYEDMPLRKDMIEGIVDHATLEELRECAKLITENIEIHDPATYYDSAIAVYHNISQEVYRQCQRRHIISTKLRNEVEFHGHINYKYIRSLGDEARDAIDNLPPELRSQIIKNGLTIEDINRLEKRNEENEKKDLLHKKILEYAKNHFAKEYLDVHMDIMTKENKGGIHFSTPSTKKDSLLLVVGLIDMPSQFIDERYEFTLEYGAKCGMGLEKIINDMHTYLDESRNGEYKYHDYKSLISPDRNELQDDELLGQISAMFPDYVAFEGDFLFRNMHGHSIFERLIEFDVSKIRDNEYVPQNKLDEIKMAVMSLLADASSIKI